MDDFLYLISLNPRCFDDIFSKCNEYLHIVGIASLDESLSWGNNPSRPDPGRREKIKLNLKGRGNTKKCENKSLIEFLFQYNFQKCTGR